MKHTSLLLSSRFLKTLPLFSEVDQNTIDTLLDAAVYRHFEEDTEILKQGEEADGMYVILKGSVSVSIIKADGTQSNLISVGQGEVVGDLECIVQRPCLATAVAEAGSATAMWPISVVARFLENPTIARNMIGLSYDRMAIVNQVRTIEHKAHVDQKIYACLLRMAAADPEIKRSQTYVAEAVGCSRQTVNRVLGKLRDEGIVELRKSVIKVVSIDRLEQMLDG